MISMHWWRDGGGEYAAVLLENGGVATLTLFGDEASTHAATPVNASPAQVRWVVTEWELANGYAACHYSDVRDDIGALDVADDAYLVVVGDERMFTITL